MGKTGQRLRIAGGALGFLLDLSDSNGPTSPIGQRPMHGSRWTQNEAGMVVSSQMKELLR